MEEITRRPAEEVLEEQGYIVDSVSGNSMYPTLREGTDTVLIKPADEILGKYDVILFRYNDKLLLHRIIKAFPEGYITRGDNSAVKEKIPKEAVIGVLAEYQRGDSFYSTRNFSFRFRGAITQYTFPLKSKLRKLKEKKISKSDK